MSEATRDELEITDSGSNRLAWFLTGAILGATVAILYAPKSGKDTRQYLTDRSKETIDTGANFLESARELFEHGRQVVEDAADLFERGRRLAKG